VGTADLERALSKNTSSEMEEVQFSTPVLKAHFGAEVIFPIASV